MTQLSVPVAVDLDAITRKKTLGSALELCAEFAGFDLDKELSSSMGIDKGQLSRWHSGTEGIKWDKFQRLMDRCGNDAPLLWMLHQRGYDLHSVRKTENEYERQNRLLREENAAMRRVLIGVAA